MRPTEKAVFAYRASDGDEETEGFYVPETEQILVIDERDENDWVITHIPTGHAVRCRYGRLRFGCPQQAVAVAQRFYREINALDGQLKSSNVHTVMRCVRDLAEADQHAFWRRVL